MKFQIKQKKNQKKIKNQKKEERILKDGEEEEREDEEEEEEKDEEEEEEDDDEIELDESQIKKLKDARRLFFAITSPPADFIMQNLSLYQLLTMVSGAYLMVLKWLLLKYLKK